MYQPGVATVTDRVFPSDKAVRNLNPDEYALYYSKIKGDEIDNLTKIAVAIVLDNDLKNLYLTYYKDYKDDYLLNLVNSYSSLTGEAKKKVDSEVFDFKTYLTYPAPTYEEYENRIRNRNMFVLDVIHADSAKEKEAAIEKLLEKEMEDKDPSIPTTGSEKAFIKRILNKHMKENIRGYLAAIFTMEDMTKFMIPQYSEFELWMRQDVIAKVEKGTVPGGQALEAYKLGLKYMKAGALPTDIRTKYLEKIFVTVHPFAKVLR